MASRYPLVLDEATNRLRELPNGDDLNLAGNNITGLIGLTTTGGITVGGSLNVTGESNANEINATTGNITTINATTIDASTITIDGEPLSSTQVQSDWDQDDITAISYILNKPLIPQDVADLSDNDNLLSGGFSGDYNDLTNLPSIPTDVQDLTDNSSLLPSDVSDLTDNSNIIKENFTDLNDTADDYIGQASKLMVVNPTENGIGFVGQGEITLNLSQITGGLGYTPYNGTTNPSNFINRGNLSGIGDISYNEATGEFSFNNSTGYLVSESDTLDSVTTRGGATTNGITAGSFTTTGGIVAGSLSLGSDLVFSSDGAILIDSSLAGIGGTITLGGTGNIAFDSFSEIPTTTGIVPASGATVNLGSNGNNWDNIYVNTVNTNVLTTSGSTFTLDLAATNSVLQLGADRRVEIVDGSFKLPSSTNTAGMTGIASPTAGEIVYNPEDKVAYMYVDQYDTLALSADQDKWISLNIRVGQEPTYVHEGMLALANGVDWDPTGTGSRSLQLYTSGAWETIY